MSLDNNLPSYNKPNYRFFDADYFESGQTISDERLKLIEQKAKTLPVPEIYGKFRDQNHYLDSVDLLLASSLEVEHRYEILSKEILPKMKGLQKLLDIGIGNGHLSEFVGKYFSYITAVDVSLESLNNLPDVHWLVKEPVSKINKSILDVEIAELKFNMILASNIIYYIPIDLRTSLINKLYSMLNEDGIIVLIYNENGDRHSFTEHFKGHSYDFADLEKNIISLYHDVTIYSCNETMKTKDILSMLHISGVCLNDASAETLEPELMRYLNEFHLDENGYHMDMIHKIIVIGKDELDA